LNTTESFFSKIQTSGFKSAAKTGLKIFS